MSKRCKDYYGDFIHMSTFDDNRSIVIDLLDLPPVLRLFICQTFREACHELNHKLPSFVSLGKRYGDRD